MNITKKRNMFVWTVIFAAIIFWHISHTFAASTTIWLTIVESGSSTTWSTTTGTNNTWTVLTWIVNTGTVYGPLFGGGSIGPNTTIITFSWWVITPTTWTTTTTTDNELIEAFTWAQKNNITHATSIDIARLYSPITRAELAKMMVQYVTNIQKKSIPSNSQCVIENYKDSSSMDSEQKQYITHACQLWIMWWQNDKKNLIEYFRPIDTVTRAEFATVLSRYLYGNTYNGDMSADGWYKNHLKALNQAAYIKKIDTPFMRELRGFVMLILYRIK